VEDAGIESRQVTELDLYGSDECVPLVVGMLADHRGEFVGEWCLVRRQSGVVVVAELDDEVVRYQGAITPDDGGLVVEFTLQSRGNLDRLHFGFEGPREDAFDQPTDPALEALEHTH
jgi:hypothetical protein